MVQESDPPAVAFLDTTAVFPEDIHGGRTSRCDPAVHVGRLQFFLDIYSPTSLSLRQE